MHTDYLIDTMQDKKSLQISHMHLFTWLSGLQKKENDSPEHCVITAAINLLPALNNRR